MIREQKARLRLAATNDALRQAVPQKYSYRERPRILIYFRQEDGDMPDNGEEFAQFSIPLRKIKIFGIQGSAKTGTFTIQATVGGSAVGVSTTGDYESFVGVAVQPDGKFSLKVITSSSCEEFQGILHAYEV